MRRNGKWSNTITKFNKTMAEELLEGEELVPGEEVGEEEKVEGEEEAE